MDLDGLQHVVAEIVDVTLKLTAPAPALVELLLLGLPGLDEADLLLEPALRGAHVADELLLAPLPRHAAVDAVHEALIGTRVTWTGTRARAAALFAGCARSPRSTRRHLAAQGEGDAAERVAQAEG